MEKIRVLFICLGNICRSPMAEAVFLRIIDKEDNEKWFEVDSAGLSSFHQGELPDSRMRTHAAKRNYHLTHRSRPVTQKDLDYFDFIIAMDEQNIRGLRNLAGGTPERFGKVYRMTDFCQRMSDDEVPDPYYGGEAGFEHVIDLLEDACEGLYKSFFEDFKQNL